MRVGRNHQVAESRSAPDQLCAQTSNYLHKIDTDIFRVLASKVCVLCRQILALDTCKEPEASKDAFSNFMRAEILPVFARTSRSLPDLKV